MKTYIFLGGPTELYPQDIFNEVARAQKNNANVIGVDHGNVILIAHQIIPDIAVGDYDSLSTTEKKIVAENVADIRFAPPEKDFTDSQMGLITAFEDLKSGEAIVIGATGGRIDHFLVNLFCVLMPNLSPYLDKIKMIDQQNIIHFFGPGSHQVKKIPTYKYIGFINLTAVKNLNLINPKYQLHDFSVNYPVSWASNEFIDDYIDFSFEKGIVSVIYSRDK